MKTLPVFEDQNLKDLLPLKVSFSDQSRTSRFHNFDFDLRPKRNICQLEEPDEGCLRPDKDVFCFQGGDARSNENMVTLIKICDGMVILASP